MYLKGHLITDYARDFPYLLDTSDIQNEPTYHDLLIMSSIDDASVKQFLQQPVCQVHSFGQFTSVTSERHLKRGR